MKLTILDIKAEKQKPPRQVQKMINYLQGLKLGEVVTSEGLAAATGTTVNYVQGNTWIYFKPYSRLHGKRRYYGSLTTMDKFDKEITNGR